MGLTIDWRLKVFQTNTASDSSSVPLTIPIWEYQYEIIDNDKTILIITVSSVYSIHCETVLPYYIDIRL